MKIFNYTLILFFTLALFSCGGGGGGSDKTAPSINFAKPSTNAASPTTITSGQTVTFSGTVSDNKELKSITFTNLIVKAKSIDDFVQDFNEQLNSKKPNSTAVLDKETYSVNFSIETLGGAPAADYTLTCTVIDSSGNPKEVTFYIKVE